jgi:FkbM family methyltransferase
VSEPFNVLTDARYGPMLVNRHDVYVGRSFIEYGEFSEQEVACLRRFVEPGMVVLDIGANIGALTVPLAQMVGPTGRVIAFEPQRLAFQLLNANIALNSLANVIALRLAVGERDMSITVPELDPHVPQNVGGISLSIFINHPGEKVPMITLDGVDLPTVGLIKCDVEGMEAAVLVGASAIIARDKPVLYLEADRADAIPYLREELSLLDYAAFRHSPPLFNPDNYRGNRVNVFQNAAGQLIVSDNWLCVPVESADTIQGLERVL